MGSEQAVQERPEAVLHTEEAEVLLLRHFYETVMLNVIFNAVMCRNITWKDPTQSLGLNWTVMEMAAERWTPANVSPLHL